MPAESGRANFSAPTRIFNRTSAQHSEIYLLLHSLIRNLSVGSIAGIPLCCQQRTSPWTRREHGVPFLVRAPQM